MSSPKSKLRLAGALAALASLALAVSCRGFFVNPVLTSIAISPSSPQVALNTQLSPALIVFGTYDDGSRSQVRSGVSWTSSDPNTVSIDPSSGIITGVQIGTATITAEAQALTATASATTYLTSISQIVVDPTSASISGSSKQDFTFTATTSVNGHTATQVITTDNGGILTINPSSTDLTCAPNVNFEECTADGLQTTTQTYTITMSYPGTTQTAVATLTVSP